MRTQKLFEQRDKSIYGTRRERPWVMYYNDMGEHLASRMGMWVWNASPPRPRWTKPSQAWIKCYEMLSLNPLIRKTSTRLRTFHICEMPGNFIHACGTWARAHIPGFQSYDWHATSLSPNCEGCDGAFGDDYGFMKTNPSNWSFGADGTGDITVVDNIQKARELAVGATLVTADCGMAGSDDGVAKLMFAEIVAVMHATPLHANAVLKLYVPTTMQHRCCVQAIAVLASLFETVKAHKPVVNEYSPEIYFVCQNKTRELTAKEWGYFKKTLASKVFDADAAVIPRTAFDSKYPLISIWLIAIVDEMHDINNYNLHRVFFYWDLTAYRPKVMAAHMPLLDRRRVAKCAEWVELVHFVPAAGALQQGKRRSKP
jgi:hypothetical protein